MRKSYLATIWSVLDRVWSQIVGLFIGIVLARLLTPEDYGLVGISTIFITFSNVFIEAGFSNALIRKLDRTQTDYSTAFHFNVIMGVVMYLVLYISSPFIADYFEDQQLVLLTRIVSITVILNSLCIVQNAILTAELRMKEQAFINIASQIPSGLVAIYLAYRGLGVYSLVVFSVLSAFIRTLMFWIVAKWLPTMEFSKESMSYLWGFGSKLIGANFLGTVFNEIYSVLIGKYVGKSDLGLYSKGRSLSTQTDNICNGVVQKVAIPLLSKYQGDTILLKEKYRDLTMMITCVMTLVSGILIVVARPLILLIWGEKWVETVPIFQILLLCNIVSNVQYLTLIILQIVNHTEYTLKLEFIKKPVYLLVILLLLQFGLYGLLAAMFIVSLISTIVNMSAPSKYIGYTYIEQIKDVSKYLVAWVIGSVVVFSLSNFVQFNCVVDIVFRTIIMSLVYCAVLWGLRDSLFLDYIKKIQVYKKDRYGF